MTDYANEAKLRYARLLAHLTGKGWKFLAPDGCTYHNDEPYPYALPAPGEKWGPWNAHPDPAPHDGRDCGAGRLHVMKHLDVRHAPRGWWPWEAEWRGLVGENKEKVGAHAVRLRRVTRREFWWRLRDGEGAGRCLRGADLRHADLRDASFQNSDLGDASLQGADLRGTDLRGTNLRGANLQNANLQNANLRGANLLGANLLYANLRGANLLGANLIGADLRDANLRGALTNGAIGLDR